jgi:hypothetical protein
MLFVMAPRMPPTPIVPHPRPENALPTRSPTSPERAANDRGWGYVIESDEGSPGGILTPNGRPLTRRAIGAPGRVEVQDTTRTLPIAALLRVAHAAGHALAAAERADARIEIPLGERDRAALASQTRHAFAASFQLPSPHPARPRPEAALGASPVDRALFFESLMASDMRHNDAELSQGVLHMVSGLRDTPTEVVLARVKMPIEGDERPVQGLHTVEEALARGPVGLVCITLLEGYWEGVVQLIAALRGLGCRAHVAVGGVMPTLTPEHVAAHLEGVSVICRGAGERFVPALCRILGGADIDTPLNPAQRTHLLALDGLIAIDRAAPGGTRLLAARSDRVCRVENPDALTLDLQHIAPRHLAQGVELVTSKGCVHRCTFCTIIGRESYEARSATSTIALLRRYTEHYQTIFPDGVPDNAHRLHLADDDFACDRHRAVAFLQQLETTPFRLSSVQVSVADLCRRESGRLLPEPDPALFSALRPELFADHGRDIPDEDHVLDQRRRGWSAYLQLGVESYCDRELIRLGKGYRVAHIRAIVAATAARGVHVDGYFIQSNADTAPEDLIDVIDEIARLKLRFPRHFHVRFPAVPHLISFFPSASYRRLLRGGHAEAVLALRHTARVPGYPELDYPFVDHDRPKDPLVRAAVAADFFTDADRYAASHAALRQVWQDTLRSLPAGPARWRVEALCRRLDDRARRLAFGWLTQARRRARGHRDDGWPRPLPGVGVAIEGAVALLGPVERWKDAYRAWSRPAPVVTLDPDAPDDIVQRARGLAASTDREGAMVLPPGHPGPESPARLTVRVDAAGGLHRSDGGPAGHLDEAASLDRLSMPPR